MINCACVNYEIIYLYLHSTIIMYIPAGRPTGTFGILYSYLSPVSLAGALDEIESQTNYSLFMTLR